MVRMLRFHYRLVEKDTSQVSIIWKGSHIILLLCAAVSGFITCYSFGKVSRAFGDNCILYANVTFEMPTTTPKPLIVVTQTTIISNTTNDTTTTLISSEVPKKVHLFPDTYHNIDKERTEWGDYEMCCFCQFTPLMSMIFALCWVMFFIMCGKGGSGYKSDLLLQPWHIVYPAIIFSVLFAIVLSISTIHTTRGLTEFCKEFHGHTVTDIYRCIPEIDIFTKIFWNGRIQKAYANSVMCYFFAYVGVMAWWTQASLLIVRVFCVVDFIMALKISPNSSREMEEVEL